MDKNKIVLGSANFGSSVSKNLALSIIDYAFDFGINKIDTADSYLGSEEIIGSALKGRRDKFFLASKVGNPSEIGSGLSKSNIESSLNNSLIKLKTDYLDVYFSHNYDKNTSLFETMSTYNKIKESGKANHFGCSNFTLDQLISSREISSQNNLVNYTFVQPVFNIIEFYSQFDFLLYCNNNNLVSWGYSPLAGGLLTGKYLGGIPPISRASDFPNANPRQAGFIPKISPSTNKIVRNIITIADEYKVSSTQLSISWALSQSAISSVIIGVSSLAQLSHILDFKIDPEAISKVDKLLIYSF
jgi:aryl-alcohol dehydrogenase-like predicted oxidoreductase